MYHPTEKIAYIIAFVMTVVEHWLKQEIAQWVNQEELIRQSTTAKANIYMLLPCDTRLEAGSALVGAGPIGNNFGWPRLPVNLHQVL